MAKQTKQSSGGSPLSLHIGDDVFYQHPEHGKTSARCTKPSDGIMRDQNGQLADLLIVFLPTGLTEPAIASRGREPGQWDTTQPGD